MARIITPGNMTRESAENVQDAAAYLLSQAARPFVPSGEIVQTGSGVLGVRETHAPTYDEPSTDLERFLAQEAKQRGIPYKASNPSIWTSPRRGVHVIETEGDPREQTRSSSRAHERHSILPLAPVFGGLGIVVLSTAALGAAVNGHYRNIEGAGQNGHAVTLTQPSDTTAVSTDPIGFYDTNPTSSVPEEPQLPRLQITSWGRIKADYRNAVPSAKALRLLLNPATLEINGGTTHWSVTHQYADLVGTDEFNAAVSQKIWTLAPYFTDVQMDVDVLKQALYVLPIGLYTDNKHWPSGAFPLSVDGWNYSNHAQGFAGAMVDSLNLDSGIFVQHAGASTPFYFADGQVTRGVNGVFWIFNDPNGNNTEFFCANPNDISEITAAVIHTKSGPFGWDNRNIRHHEELRAAYGMAASSFLDSRYGITRTDNISPMNDYDEALIQFVIMKTLCDEAGTNEARMEEMH
jgi:hypothetical protein